VLLGTVLAKEPNRRFHEAFFWLWLAVRENKRSGWALGNYGMVLGELGQPKEAEKALRRATELAPANAIHWDNLGNTLERQGHHEEALKAYDRAIKLDPDNGTLLHNRSVVLCRSGRVEEAMPDLRRAIELEPDLVDARFNLGLSALLLGDYEEGFRHYESRWDTREYAAYRAAFQWPKWIGQEPIAGKRIMVIGDQGLGDTIMFCRYLPLLMGTGAEVYAVAPAALFEVMRDTFAPLGVMVLHSGQALPDIQLRTAFASLPLAFGTRLDTIPKPVRFVTPNRPCPYGGADRAEGRLRVGVCWSGNFQHKNDANRSIPFAQFAALLDNPEIQFVSLQQEVREEDRSAFEARGRHLSTPDLKTFADTAWLVRNLDLVITVDTSVAHIAATQGVQTWILLPQHGSDWRWMRHRNDSPWYPTATLLRQQRHGDWPGTLRVVREQIGRLTEVAA
jgi:hypothetical protein